MISKKLLLLVFILITITAHSQNGPECIPFGTSVTADGLLSDGEWDDAESVVLDLGNDALTILFKHDGENLNFAYEGNITANICFPELCFDPNLNLGDSWQSDDSWFHVSATDCHNQGDPEVYDDCMLVQPDWLAAPNYQNNGIILFMEIQIPFQKISSTLSSFDELNLTFGCNSPLGSYSLWPESAEILSPETWTILTICEDTFDTEEHTEEANVSYRINEKGEIEISGKDGELIEEVHIYNLQGSLIHSASSIYSNEYTYSRKKVSANPEITIISALLQSGKSANFKLIY